MAASALGLGAGQSAAQLTRTLERLLEDAQLTGELRLNGRKLRELPKCTAKYDLRDTVHADLSKNRLYELPPEVCQLSLLERLDCHNNLLRTVPSSVISMQSLTYLDLSRNQLSTVPAALCQLPIQVLILSNNRLVSLPQEIGLMKCLMDLDASCNELCLLPPGIGELSGLRCLRVRRNRLVELPVELCGLRLWRLDLGANRLARLPPALRLMTSLQELLLDCNPIVSPPAFLCTRGKVHVFKFLEMEAIKEDRKRGALLDSEFRKGPRSNPGMLGELRHLNGQLPEAKRSTLDSGYSTSDGDRRWSQDTPESGCEPEEGGRLALRAAEATKERRQERELQLHRHLSESSPGRPRTPSTLSPGSEVDAEEAFAGELALEEMDDTNQKNGDVDAADTGGVGHVQGISYRWPPAPPESGEGPGVARKAYPHIQTYREFKEALRQQRLGGGLGPRRGSEGSGNGSLPSSTCSSPPVPGNNHVTPEEEFRARHEAIVHQQRLEAALAQQRLEQDRPAWRQPPCQSAPKVERGAVREAPSPGRPNGLTPPAERGKGSPRTPPRRALAVGPDPHFTIRRGLEKAREEQELLDQLRWVIESRLKVSLPPELGPSLMDGVVLCHLANQVRPRSVASIHVPSPAVPKLTMAKCRRNVENFLGACRQLGVPEGDLFFWEDLVLRLDAVRAARATASLLRGFGPPVTRADRLLAPVLLGVFVATCVTLAIWSPSSHESASSFCLGLSLAFFVYLYAGLAGML
ncbi:DISP complex protein LRCH3 isoform X1 [Ixodes scapularis]